MNGRLGEIAERAGASVEDLIRYLDSPAGRRLRRVVATGLIVSAPVVMRIPGLRKTPLGRVVELVGGATLVVKIAELIRDWEPTREWAPRPAST
jgi:hypothetical protein